mgnify:CR=1 FL=1
MEQIKQLVMEQIKQLILMDFKFTYSPMGKYIVLDNEEGLKIKVREGEKLIFGTSDDTIEFKWNELLAWLKN